MGGLRALVHRRAAENPSWGAPRLHGELQKLGLVVSERTVSRFVPRRPVDPAARQRWRTFLSNHREAFPYDQAPRYLILDHVIVPNEKHLQRLLAGFASYDLDDRTHLSLKKDAPAMRAVETNTDPAAEIIARPRLGGLHHRYGRRPAV